MRKYYSDRQSYLLQLDIVRQDIEELQRFDAYNDDEDNAIYFNVSRDLDTIKEKLVDKANKVGDWNIITGINRYMEDVT